MSMKDLLSSECGQQNAVLRVASHFSGNGPSGASSIVPGNLLGHHQRTHEVSESSVHGVPHGTGGELLPPTTFRMDSLLREIQSLERPHGLAQAPRVADLTRSEEWVQEFQLNDLVALNVADPNKWAEEFHANKSDTLHLDRAWEASSEGIHPSMLNSFQVPLQTSVLAKDLLDDTKWANEYENKTELMTTAEEFIQSINDPTIKATDFMSFVEKLSTGDIAVDNKSEQNEMAGQWAGEFLAETGTSTDGAWVGEYEGAAVLNVDSENLNPTERQAFWQKLQNEWDRAAEESGYQHPWLSESQQFEQPYRFEEDNPFRETSDPLEEGKKRLLVSDIPAAALYFEAAVQKQADNPEAWYLLGTTQALNEQDPQAIAALTKCADLEPGNLKALMALAASLTNESYYLQACRILKTWLKQNPEYSYLVSEDIEKPSSTSSMLSSNELSTVQNMYMKAARKRPAHDLDADVQCGLGVLFNLSSEYDKAGDCFQAAVNADPNNALMWNRLGATLANGGKSAEAIGAYSKALEIIPGFIRTRYNLGIACVNLGSYREAAEHFLSALNMQASSSNSVSASATTHSNARDSRNIMSDSIWTSLRMVLHLLDKGKLSSAIDNRDLVTLNQEFR